MNYLIIKQVIKLDERKSLSLKNDEKYKDNLLAIKDHKEIIDSQEMLNSRVEEEITAFKMEMEKSNSALEKARKRFEEARASFRRSQVGVLAAQDDINWKESKNALIRRSIARKMNDDRKFSKEHESQRQKLEDQNNQLKEVIADLTTDISMLKEAKEEMNQKINEEKKATEKIKEKIMEESDKTALLQNQIHQESEKLQQEEQKRSQLKEKDASFEKSRDSRDENLKRLNLELEQEQKLLKKEKKNEDSAAEKSKRLSECDLNSEK